MTILEEFPDGEVLAIQDDDERVDAVTRKIMAIVCCSVELNNYCNLLLSSNPALEQIYSMLMLDPDLRGLPWQFTHVWRLQKVNDESMYEMITCHSGIPEEHVHHEFALDAVQHEHPIEFDCCILDISDVGDFHPEIASACKSIIVFATDREELSKTTSIETKGAVYWITSTIDLLEDNH